MKRNRQMESSLLLGLPDLAQEGGALAGETASRAVAALAHFPGGNSWQKVLTDFAAQEKSAENTWPGIAALMLSGEKEAGRRAEEKAANTDLKGIRTPQDAYLYIPGLVLAETKTGTRGRYSDLLNTLAAVPAAREEDLSLLMACATESMEWMDQAVYEVYRGFQDIFRKCLDRLTGQRDGDAHKRQGDICVLFSSYAILKACRLGAVLTDVYAEPAEKACAKIIRHADESADALLYAAAALVYAEGIRNRDYRDYGRKNGGVLWS